MKRVKEILEKVLNGRDLNMEDYIYLQQHKHEAQETCNLELIDIATTDSGHDPSYKFLKVI